MPKKMQKEDLFCFKAVMARKHLPLRSKMQWLILRLRQYSPLMKRIIFCKGKTKELMNPVTNLNKQRLLKWKRNKHKKSQRKNLLSPKTSKKLKTH